MKFKKEILRTSRHEIFTYKSQKGHLKEIQQKKIRNFIKEIRKGNPKNIKPGNPVRKFEGN